MEKTKTRDTVFSGFINFITSFFGELNTGEYQESDLGKEGLKELEKVRAEEKRLKSLEESGNGDLSRRLKENMERLEQERTENKKTGPGRYTPIIDSNQKNGR